MKPVYTLKDLQNHASIKGGECLSVAYGKGKDKYEWKCSKGHMFSMTWAQIHNKGSWCEICRIEKMAVTSRKYSIQSLIDFANNRHSSCLSKEYTGIFNKYDFVCEFGHNFSIRWSDALAGSWCQSCSKTKYQIEDLQDYAKNKNGKCLSTNYVNYSHKYLWECSKGHSWSASWHSVKDGNTWCKICSTEQQAKDRIKDSIIDLQNYAAKNEGRCLSTIYTKSKDKYDWECSKGHQWSSSWHNMVTKGYWCSRCANKQRGIDSRKHTITDLQNFAKEKNGECLTKEYTSINSLYTWKCRCGNIWQAQWNGIKSGHWCAICAQKEVSTALIKRNLKDLEKLAKTFGGESLEIEESGYKYPKKWKCKNGHVWEAMVKTVQEGSWCRLCDYKDKLLDAAAKANLTVLNPNFDENTQYYQWKCSEGHIEERALQSVVGQNYCTICNKTNTNINKLAKLKELAISRGGKCLSNKYITNYTTMEFECAKGHKWKTRAKDIKAGSWCPDCNVFGAAEQTVRDFVNLYHENHKIRLYELGISSKKEIDIYIPSLRVGIEYCGLFWHSEKYFHKNKHREKYKLCLDNGIRLITLFSDEWQDRREQVQNFLKSLINKNNIKIPARKCTVRFVNKREALKFIDNRHIQKLNDLDIAVGLYHEDKLVGIMTGGRHHRNQKDSVLVLTRMVFEHDTTVQGGASKLFKYFVEYARENNFNKVITWADLRWTNGDVYYKLGMTVAETLPPDYSYTKNFNTRISKQSCTKVKLIAKGAVGNTEREMANSLGLHRIYDCGKIRFEYDLRNNK